MFDKIVRVVRGGNTNTQHRDDGCERGGGFGVVWAPGVVTESIWGQHEHAVSGRRLRRTGGVRCCVAQEGITGSLGTPLRLVRGDRTRTCSATTAAATSTGSIRGQHEPAVPGRRLRRGFGVVHGVVPGRHRGAKRRGGGGQTCGHRRLHVEIPWSSVATDVGR